MPRPDLGRQLVPVRMDPDLLDLIDADSDDDGTSRSAVIRQIIRQHYARAKRR